MNRLSSIKLDNFINVLNNKCKKINNITTKRNRKLGFNTMRLKFFLSLPY